ncbi:hypothetical protein KSS87_002020 [Heliosperma pusillum]|nr:hypothetical protein KSS87_002020 [Heliosperma pusillum]
MNVETVGGGPFKSFFPVIKTKDAPLPLLLVQIEGQAPFDLVLIILRGRRRRGKRERKGARLRA